MWKRDNSNPKNTPFLNPTLTPSFTSTPPPPPPPPSPSPVKKKNQIYSDGSLCVPEQNRILKQLTTMYR